ncbi:MAG: DUF3450 domain-containing protein [Pseudomonadales bacterium]
MNMHRIKTIALATIFVGSAVLGSATTAQADTLDNILKVGQANTKASQSSQKKVDKLADETGDLLQDYKTVLKQIEGLKVYNARLDKQIDNQNKRIGDIETSIGQVTVIQRQMLPLVIRMVDSLEEFVSLDVPFHIEERNQRIGFLRNNLDRSDLTVAEKFRQVLEGYKIEAEYGRKIDTYKSSVEIDGESREVNMLRIGRISLLYQTTDTTITGAWDQDLKEWVQLDSGQYKSAVQKGIRIAQNQAVKDIMTVAIQAPEAGN